MQEIDSDTVEFVSVESQSKLSMRLFKCEHTALVEVESRLTRSNHLYRGKSTVTYVSPVDWPPDHDRFGPTYRPQNGSSER